MVVVEKFSKTSHFIPVKSTYKTLEIVYIFVKEIFHRHGIPKTVISNRDVKFTSTFWKNIFLGLGTQVQFSTAYHPQMDGPIERVNQVLVDMLRMFVMQQPHKWQDYLHLVEFSYNNGHHESLGMSPFKVLYGRKCRVPIQWNNPFNKFAVGPDMLAEMEETVRKFRQNLRATQDRQKMYADKKNTYREFQPGYHVYLRVKPQKSSLQWQGCAKLAPRYCGPFQVLERVGPVAYKLALPSHIWVHNVFHVSLLKKYVYNPQNIIDWENIQVKN